MSNGSEQTEMVQQMLRQQEYCSVSVTDDWEEFERTVSAAACHGMLLHSWNISPYGKFVALFMPVIENAIESRAADIARGVTRR